MQGFSSSLFGPIGTRLGLAPVQTSLQDASSRSSMPMGMDASMLIPSGLLSPPSLDPSPLSQAVSSGTGRQPGSAAGQLGGAGQQQPRSRSSLNPAAPGFQSMRPPVANGLHAGPPKQQSSGERDSTHQSLRGCL